MATKDYRSTKINLTAEATERRCVQEYLQSSIAFHTSRFRFHYFSYFIFATSRDAGSHLHSYGEFHIGWSKRIYWLQNTMQTCPCPSLTQQTANSVLFSLVRCRCYFIPISKTRRRSTTTHRYFSLYIGAFYHAYTLRRLRPPKISRYCFILNELHPCNLTSNN